MYFMYTIAIQQRREKIEAYDREMEKFKQSTAQAQHHVDKARQVLWTDLDNITPSKCAELADQCQVRII